MNSASPDPFAPLPTEKENFLLTVASPFVSETPRLTPRRRPAASPIPKASMSVQASPFPSSIHKDTALAIAHKKTPSQSSSQMLTLVNNTPTTNESCIWIIVKGVVTDAHRQQVQQRFSNAIQSRQGRNYVALQFETAYQAEMSASVHSGLRFYDGMPFGVELASSSDPLVRATTSNLFVVPSNTTADFSNSIYQSQAPPRQAPVWESICRWLLSID